MTATPFDFRVSPVGPSERVATNWLTEASQAAAKLWARQLPFGRELRGTRVERRSPEKLLASLSKITIGIDLKALADGENAGFLAIERPFLLGLVSGMVGGAIQSLPADREFTYVEQSLVGLVIPLLLEPLTAAWPGSVPLRIEVTSFGAPKANCRLPLDEPAMEATLSVTTDFGSATVSLSLPLFGPLSTDAVAAGAARTTPSFDRRQTESVLREMPVEFAVDLGQTELSLRQITELKSGDILVLDQRIVEPLPAKIEGKDRFRVSPGAMGVQQAVRIHSICPLAEPSPAGK